MIVGRLLAGLRILGVPHDAPHIHHHHAPARTPVVKAKAAVAAPSYASPLPLTMQEAAEHSTSYMASHLERCYESSLERMFDEDLVACHELVAGDDGKWSIGAEQEAEAVRQLSSRLPSILEAAGSDATSLWGVTLTDDDSAERASLLAAFLRARKWRVDEAEEFLLETFTWRKANHIDDADARGDPPPTAFPADQICVRRNRDEEPPQMFVYLHLGSLELDMFRQVENFIKWRVREQEKACEQLSKHQHWKHSPRGPTYTLVLDCAGLRPYHFGRAMRKSVSALTHDFIHYYPDFVGARISKHRQGTAAPSPHSHPLSLLLPTQVRSQSSTHRHS